MVGLAAVICVALFRESDWMLLIALFGGLAAWHVTDDILKAGRRDSSNEGDEKDGRGADPARP
jgi:hypothetical protein